MFYLEQYITNILHLTGFNSGHPGTYTSYTKCSPHTLGANKYIFYGKLLLIFTGIFFKFRTKIKFVFRVVFTVTDYCIHLCYVHTLTHNQTHIRDWTEAVRLNST